MVHPTLWLFFIIALVTGTFIQFAIIITIVFIHELGHYVAARYYKWRIQKIILWVFGGIMVTDEHESRPLKEEFIVTIAGPLQHIIIFIFLYLLHDFEIVSLYVFEEAMFFNGIILLFNLLPIYPLDGGKICKVIVSYFLPFRRSFQLVLLISFIVCILFMITQLFVFPFTLTATLVIVFLIIEVYKHWKHEYFTFMRFLLHRLHSGQFTKNVKRIDVTNDERLIDLFNQFKCNIYYYINITPDYCVPETDCLRRFFYENRHHETVKKIYKS
jgi:stage IV sporulation protein FB